MSFPAQPAGKHRSSNSHRNSMRVSRSEIVTPELRDLKGDQPRGLQLLEMTRRIMSRSVASVSTLP